MKVLALVHNLAVSISVSSELYLVLNTFSANFQHIHVVMFRAFEMFLVNNGISKGSNEALKALHKICYGAVGKETIRRKDLRKFNGFNFTEKSAEFERKKTNAMKLNTTVVSI